ncbi:hypothetical protein [Phaffia rhodozyma]|uniref:Protein rds1 n=1 Tax=Phaffia rhodozyma TaxID=264483 RepID=A0A0F7SZ44_PHARH|nr:hypothetical protein [Phaffia rhodozyma]
MLTIKLPSDQILPVEVGWTVRWDDEVEGCWTNHRQAHVTSRSILEMIANVLLAALPILSALNGVAAAPVNGSIYAPPPPPGGVDTNATSPAPVYAPDSDFDYQSLALALHQEWIELDLFHYGLATFSDAEFDEYGINAEQRSLIQFMANQEVGHATLISNIVGGYPGGAPKQCTYKYNFTTVPEFVDFCQRLTRWGESGVYGFLPHLDSRPAAQLLLQSISTEARQQMIFRQLSGLFPMPVYFEAGIPQTFAWTLLSPYIVSCPAENTPIAFNIFPSLTVVNGPSGIDEAFQKLPYPTGGPAITHNRTALSYPGRLVELAWETPGQVVGPYNQTTAIGDLVTTNASAPLYVAWTSQLNTTYTLLTVTGNGTGTTIQPNGTVFDSTPDDAIVNGTSFVTIVSEQLPVTSYNLSLINDYVVAGPSIYQAS